jgi:hypothetical protein
MNPMRQTLIVNAALENLAKEVEELKALVKQLLEKDQPRPTEPAQSEKKTTSRAK